MKIDLDRGEELRLIIDGTCEFKVWGERNDEGTMILKFTSQGNDAVGGKS